MPYCQTVSSKKQFGLQAIYLSGTFYMDGPIWARRFARRNGESHPTDRTENEKGEQKGKALLCKGRDRIRYISPHWLGSDEGGRIMYRESNWRWQGWPGILVLIGPKTGSMASYPWHWFAWIAGLLQQTHDPCSWLLIDGRIGRRRPRKKNSPLLLKSPRLLRKRCPLHTTICQLPASKAVDSNLLAREGSVGSPLPEPRKKNADGRG